MAQGKMLSPWALRYLFLTHDSITYLKNNLSAHGGVAKRFKMLTYYRVCSAFSPFRALP
jgi:hypothetical protein